MINVPDELPTAARQTACYRGSSVRRAAVDNSPPCHFDMIVNTQATI